MRHTKIIATVGPACEPDGMLDALIAPAPTSSA